MRYRAIVVLLLLVLVAVLLVLPSIAGAAQGKGMAPPGLHKAPAVMKAPVHTVCVRCHMDPTFAGCMGAGCH